MKKTRYTQLAYAFIPAAVSIYSCGSFSSARAADVWCGTAPIWMEVAAREKHKSRPTFVAMGPNAGRATKRYVHRTNLPIRARAARSGTSSLLGSTTTVPKNQTRPRPVGRRVDGVERWLVSAGICLARDQPERSRLRPPDVRAQAQADNAEAHNRVSPGGGDTCRSGFVWRAAFNGDNVCVTPATRTQTAEDNAKAGERVVSALSPISETWPTLSDGDCQLQNAKLVYHPQGYAEFTAQVRTNHAGSGGFVASHVDGRGRCGTRIVRGAEI